MKIKGEKREACGKDTSKNKIKEKQKQGSVLRERVVTTVTQ